MNHFIVIPARISVCKPILYLCCFILFYLVFKRCIFLDYPPQYAGLNEEKATKLKNKLTIALSWLSLTVQNTVSKITSDKDAQQVQYPLICSIVEFKSKHNCIYYSYIKKLLIKITLFS